MLLCHPARRGDCGVGGGEAEPSSVRGGGLQGAPQGARLLLPRRGTAGPRGAPTAVVPDLAWSGLRSQRSEAKGVTATMAPAACGRDPQNPRAAHRVPAGQLSPGLPSRAGSASVVQGPRTAQTPPAPPAARAGSGHPARLKLGAVTAPNCRRSARNPTSGPRSPHQNGDAEQTQSPGAERLEVTSPRTRLSQPAATTKAPGPCAGRVKRSPALRCDRHPSALCTGLLPAAPFAAATSSHANSPRQRGPGHGAGRQRGARQPGLAASPLPGWSRAAHPQHGGHCSTGKPGNDF